MARKVRETQLPPAPVVNEEVVRSDLQALDAVVIMNQEMDATARAVALRLGYLLPADCTDPDLIQRDIAMEMRRSVESCLQVGRGLTVLKAVCGHGNFMARLDVLGMEESVARRFMQAATKFSNRASTHVLGAASNQTKLFELLVLDDEQIDELELTGQTGELKLDDIASMSVKELRTALREARQQATAKDRLLDEKNRKIDELAGQKLMTQPWHEKVQPFKAEIGGHFDVMEESVGRLYLCHDRILQDDFGDDEETTRQALRTCAVLYGDRLKRMAQQIAELRDHFEATLAGWAGELDGRELPPAEDLAEPSAAA